MLFNRSGDVAPDPARSAQWNRGRYLVDGLGHCGACHTPRNALGAERTGAAYLAGGVAEGWDRAGADEAVVGAHALERRRAFRLSAHRRLAHHGTAAGPMAPVISELKALPD